MAKKQADTEPTELTVLVMTPRGPVRIPRADFDKMKQTKEQRETGAGLMPNRAMFRRKNRTRDTKPVRPADRKPDKQKARANCRKAQS